MLCAHGGIKNWEMHMGIHVHAGYQYTEKYGMYLHGQSDCRKFHSFLVGFGWCQKCFCYGIYKCKRELNSLMLL